MTEKKDSQIHFSFFPEISFLTYRCYWTTFLSPYSPASLFLNNDSASLRRFSTVLQHLMLYCSIALLLYSRGGALTKCRKLNERRVLYLFSQKLLRWRRLTKRRLRCFLNLLRKRIKYFCRRGEYECKREARYRECTCSLLGRRLIQLLDARSISLRKGIE